MNKTILITGASSGIGKATAKFFNDKGWNVIATMRSPEKETELSELQNTLVTRLDVLDLNSIKSSINEGIEKFGKIDVLLNNAGYGAWGPLETFPRENLVRQFDTNVIGLLDVTQAILPHFRANKDGVLINVSSIGGKMTFPLGSLYHGTKFAVEGITEALSYEIAEFGAKAKIVEPGAIATDFGGRSFDFQNDESVEEYLPITQKVMNMFQTGPSDRYSPASLVAEVIYEAATDGSNKLRYRAGADAETILDNREKMDDETFLNNMKEMAGIKK